MSTPTPDRPDWTTGNLPNITGSSIYTNTAAPSGTTTGKVTIPGAGRLYIAVLYASGDSGPDVGQVTVDQYVGDVLMSSRTILLWEDIRYQTTGNPEIFIVPVEGQTVELTYGPAANPGTYDTTVTWSSAPQSQVDTIHNSGTYPGTLYTVNAQSVAAGAYLDAYLPPVARALSISVVGASGNFNSSLLAFGPDGTSGTSAYLAFDEITANTGAPYTVPVPLQPTALELHNTGTATQTISVTVMDAS